MSFEHRTFLEFFIVVLTLYQDFFFVMQNWADKSLTQKLKNLQIAWTKVYDGSFVGLSDSPNSLKVFFT
jgi:hypothetical protein